LTIVVFGSAGSFPFLERRPDLPLQGKSPFFSVIAATFFARLWTNWTSRIYLRGDLLFFSLIRATPVIFVKRADFEDGRVFPPFFPWVFSVRELVVYCSWWGGGDPHQNQGTPILLSFPPFLFFRTPLSRNRLFFQLFFSSASSRELTLLFFLPYDMTFFPVGSAPGIGADLGRGARRPPNHCLPCF